MESYIHSRFNIVKKIPEGILVYNTLTQGMLLLDEAHYTMLSEIRGEDSVLETFVKYGFLISPQLDEHSLLQFRHTKAKYDPTRMYLTIAVTNACNFRCTYCYQPHHVMHLSPDVEKSILRLIEARMEKGLKKLQVHWFGGEPLLQTETILRMEEQFQKIKHFDTIQYSSSVTSNGYLINDELIAAIENTKISFFQITVDGIEEIHNTSRVLHNGTGTFATIMTNIKKLISADIPVVIRYNVNKKNEYIVPFLQYLKQEKLDTKVQLHFNEAKKGDICYTDEHIFYDSTEQYAHKMLDIYTDLLAHGFSVPRYPMHDINCEFDCIHNVLVNTDGRLFQCSACEHEPDFSLGYLQLAQEREPIHYNEGNYLRKMLRSPFNDSECMHCSVLPLCMGGCHFLELKRQNKCIPEKYIMSDLVALYYADSMKAKKVLV